MLTFEKVMEVFADYLQQDPLYELVLTSHGYTLIAWEPERNQWYNAEFTATPKDLMDSLLNAYASFREEQITDNDRDLSQQEQAELKKECGLLRAKCRGKVN